MEILKEYSRGLKKYTLSFYDYKELIKLGFKDVINRLTVFLKETDSLVLVDETHDPQSGWTGKYISICDVEFSGNGYCFDINKVNDFLKEKGY